MSKKTGAVKLRLQFQDSKDKGMRTESWFFALSKILSAPPYQIRKHLLNFQQYNKSKSLSSISPLRVVCRFIPSLLNYIMRRATPS
jgi:hypothetical protein